MKFSEMHERELIDMLGGVRPDTPLAEQLKQEIQLRIAERQARAAEVSENLAGRVWWLNVWLLVFTVALFALTIVQIFIALRTAGR
jgi:hypothetical protein